MHQCAPLKNCLPAYFLFRPAVLDDVMSQSGLTTIVFKQSYKFNFTIQLKLFLTLNQTKLNQTTLHSP